MTLKSPVVIFQALEPLQPQWPQQPQQPQWPQWPQQHQWPIWPRQPHFIKKFTDPDGWIIPGTKMTNTCLFLWNGSSKIQFFTNIWYLFCSRLLRLIDATFLKTGWWNSNGKTSWTHHPPLFKKCLILLPLRATYFRSLHYETPCIHLVNKAGMFNSNDTWNLIPLIHEKSKSLNITCN